MDTHATRRDVLRAATHGALSASVLAGMTVRSVRADPTKNAAAESSLWPGYPRQDAELVAAVVGAAHSNEQRVRELVKSYPEVVNANWDWGFGDWESPLGAASHVGHRGIAEFLLAEGARIDIFAAAMLGLTDVVKAFVVAQPGVQTALGPHGITLLAHAKAGGEQAAGTVDYLQSLGDADSGPKVAPLADSDKPRYLGRFTNVALGLNLVCRLNNTKRLVVDMQAPGSESGNRLIHYLGADAFFPAGVPSVRMQFACENNEAVGVTLHGSVPEVTLNRTDA